MMDFRLVPSVGWQAVLVVLYAVLSNGWGQFPPMGLPSNGLAPVLDATAVTIEATVGSKAILPCRVLNKGAVEIAWTTDNFETQISRNKNVLYKIERFSVDTSYKDEWNLVIDPVQPDDAGVYSCMTQMIPPQMKDVTLIVPTPPTIDTSALSAKYTKYEGGSLSVQCVASGYPEPSIKWFKYTQDPSSQTEQKDLFSSTNILTIGSLQRGDGNIYGCTAQNEHGSDMYEIFVDVIYKPELSTATRNIKANLYDDVLLECVIDSNPAGEYAWKRSGKKLQSSWKYSLETLDNLQSETKRTLRLTVLNADRKDTGDYTCYAVNEVASSKLSVSLSVVQPTSSTSTTSTTETSTTSEVSTKATPTPLSIEEPKTGKSHNAAPPCGGIVRLTVASVLTVLAVGLLS